MVFADNQKEDDTVSHYKHLSIEERESLYLGVNQGKSIRRIARELKRSASSLSRELSRNKISHRPYSPSRAQRRYQRCKKNCGRKPILLTLIHHGSVEPMKTPTVCCGNISRKKHLLMMFPMLSLRTLLQKSISALANALTGYLPLRSSLTPCCT